MKKQIKKRIVLGLCLLAVGFSNLQAQPAKRVEIILQRSGYPEETRDFLILDEAIDNFHADEVYEKIRKAKRDLPVYSIPKCLFFEGRYIVTIVYENGKEEKYNVYCEYAMYDITKDRYLKSKDVIFVIREIIALKYSGVWEKLY